MLAKLQTLLLDVVAPLVHILETAHSGNLTVDTSVKVAKLALRLLANASAHVSKERRKTSLKDLNRDLLTLIEDDEMFADVAPIFFGDGFKKTMKEHVEAMRCIRKTSSKTSNESFFQKGRPQGQYHHYRGGGNNQRGRGWHHPYQGNHYNNQSAGKEKFRKKNQSLQ